MDRHTQVGYGMIWLPIVNPVHQVWDLQNQLNQFNWWHLKLARAIQMPNIERGKIYIMPLS